MESSAFSFGILALASLCTVYGSLIFGSLGIVFSLLSRGGEYTMSKRAKFALFLSVLSLILVFFMFIYTFIFAETYFGGITNMMDAVYSETGIDYDTLMKELY